MYIKLLLFNVFLLLLCMGAGSEKLVECSDCIDYKFCPAAIELIIRKSVDAERKFHNAVCGFVTNTHLSSIKLEVCCSKLQESDTVNGLSLLPERCGEIIEDRIIGGKFAGRFDYPWMAVFNTSNSITGHCSGSVINSRYILTAASCVNGANVTTVRIGEYDLSTEVDCTEEIYSYCIPEYVDIDVDNIISHENFQSSRFEHNIALIRLKKSIPFGNEQSTVYPLCLPKTPGLIDLETISKRGHTIGWGAPETVLMKSYIYVVNESSCDNLRYTKAALSKTFCGKDIYQNTCLDEGSPLIIRSLYGNIASHVQFGILSRRACNTSYFVYTDVPQYMDWILNNIRD